MMNYSVCFQPWRVRRREASGPGAELCRQLWSQNGYKSSKCLTWRKHRNTHTKKNRTNDSVTHRHVLRVFAKLNLQVCQVVVLLRVLVLIRRSISQEKWVVLSLEENMTREIKVHTWLPFCNFFSPKSTSTAHVPTSKAHWWWGSAEPASADQSWQATPGSTKTEAKGVIKTKLIEEQHEFRSVFNRNYIDTCNHFHVIRHLNIDHYT